MSQSNTRAVHAGPRRETGLSDRGSSSPDSRPDAQWNAGKINRGSKVAHPAIHTRCRCKVAPPESPPPPRQYNAGDCASPLAIEVAWRVLSAKGTLRRLEASMGKPIGGSVQRGEAATGASARGRARAIYPAREAAEERGKRQCR